MRCRQASHLMTACLDGRLDQAEIMRLEEHLAVCGTCQAEWQRVSVVDQLFKSAPSRSAPAHLHAQVMTRIHRRDQARRAIVGGLALALGATAVALLVFVPVALEVLKNVGIAPALLVGGMETVTQLLVLLNALSRTLFVLLDQFAGPLAILSLGSLLTALALNGLWILTMRRLRVARW